MQKIGFCDRYGLTQAVLNGTKTMTRRLIPPKVVEYALNVYRQDYYSAALDYLNDKECLEGWLIVEKKSRYKLGEVVAVAQAYNDFYNDECDPRQFPNGNGWINKMFVKPSLMPHQIKITGVRIERLQAISDNDCMKEGIKEKSRFPRKKSLPYYFDGGKHEWDNSYKTPREAFAALINRPGVGRKGLWESNPWVVVYSFKLFK